MKSLEEMKRGMVDNMMALIGTGPPLPYYTCKHCNKECYFLVHVGRFWKCKECFEKCK